MTLRCIFGGTFDPIHNGHINAVSELTDLLGVKQITLLPCRIPPHKDKPTSRSVDRLNMLKLVAQDNKQFDIDDRELNKDSTSYTFETLQEMRAESPHSHLCFVVGMDSLLNFNRWYKWQQILELCHLVVMQRADDNNIDAQKSQVEQLPSEIYSALSKNKDHLTQEKSGKILLLDTNFHNISSTEIRKRIATQQSLDKLLPENIANYIVKHKLYLEGNRG